MILLHAIILAILALVAAFAAAWISHAAKLSEFRLTWIDGLRRDIADYIALAERWFRKREEIGASALEEKGKRESEEVFPLANEARAILGRIRLRIDPEASPNSPQDAQLLQSLNDLLSPDKLSPPSSWQTLADAAFNNARRTLKSEWEAARKFRWPSRDDFRR